MAEFDNFEADFGGADESAPEVDPAAEFLAREQDELAGLEDDIIDSFEPGLAGTGIPGLPNSQSPDEGLDLGDNDDGFIQMQMNGPQEPPSTLGIHPVRVAREEPEKIKKWREEQQKRLEEKDKEEEVKKLELQQTAKKELEEWYARYKEQIEKSKQANRNAEKEYVAERDAESPGQEWERIARLCDFNPKSSRNSKDTSRMRSIILQLKQTPIVRKT